MAALKNSRHEAFARALIKGMPAVKAYVEAGYSSNKASATNADRLTKNDAIRARVAELQEKTAEKVTFDTAKVLQSYIDVFEADPSTLAEVKTGACRFCHGNDHEYQWRTQNEFMQATAAWHSLPPRKRKISPQPTDEGGYGYSRRLAPNPDCPDCDGVGQTWSVIKASKGHPLFKGMRPTQYGTEVKMFDKMAALEQIGRIVGAYEKDNQQKGVTSDELLVALLTRIKTTGSKLPLNRGASVVEDK